MKSSATFVLALLLMRATLAAEEPRDPRLKEVMKVRQEISLLNLLNGLYLSDEQLGRLIGLAQRADVIEESYAKRFADGADGHLAAVQALRDGLYTPTGPSPDVKERASSGQKVIDAARDRMAEELGGVEEEAKGVLSEGQLAIVETFKPCLLPPKSLSDPVAVGQVSTTEREEAVLDVVRRMPVFLYHHRRATMARMIVERGEREKGKMPDDVREGMIRTLAGRLDAARAMSEVDFGLKKAGLAKEFKLFDDKVTYHQGHRRELGKVSRFLLNGEAAAVMAKYRDAMRSAPARTEAQELTQADPKEQQAKRREMLLRRFGRGVHAIFEERKSGGKLQDMEARGIQEEFKSLREGAADAKTFASLEKLADRLNALGVTKASLEPARARVQYLFVAKRLPNFLNPNAAKPGLETDFTGLQAMMKKADEAESQDRVKEAKAALDRLAECLKGFRD
ncbi:MAG: hypothetical protein NTX64_01590 [Elusimicrobia bacterium]|nr:hypothetical protein [Elusimicrobiota bacterium]